MRYCDSPKQKFAVCSDSTNYQKSAGQPIDYVCISITLAWNIQWKSKAPQFAIPPASYPQTLG